MDICTAILPGPEPWSGRANSAAVLAIECSCGLCLTWKAAGCAECGRGGKPSAGLQASTSYTDCGAERELTSLLSRKVFRGTKFLVGNVPDLIL